MSDEFDYQLSAANFAAAAKDYVAVVSSVSPLEVLFQGQPVSAVNGGNLPLTVGDAVRVTRFSQQLVIAGNMSAYPTQAVVSAYAAGTANCTVVAGDDTFDAQTLGAYTPVVGDRVALFWQPNATGNARCLCTRRGAAVASPADPPTAPDLMNAVSGPDLPTPPPSPAGPGVAVLYAQQTACYINTGSIFTGDQARYYVYSGNRSTDVINGYWFFGDQVSKVKDATITKAEVWLQRISGIGPSGATDVHIALHNTKTKATIEPLTLFPTPTYVTLSMSPGQSGWFTLPLSWGQSIAAGGAAGIASVTLYGTDAYKALIGIDYPNDAKKRNAQSGALRLTYTRS